MLLGCCLDSVFYTGTQVASSFNYIFVHRYHYSCILVFQGTNCFKYQIIVGFPYRFVSIGIGRVIFRIIEILPFKSIINFLHCPIKDFDCHP